ncbi:hypothetical protein DQ237_10225 [Blastococcus sp. TF02-8]|uniref:hypothetical protein n=1 Tax=Blastococcus sp. TF02-8 TaxID=2250574 RepID=UPI000DE9DC17|nr:hypothetical protein [Blastococcus sp. TF02-8]RBY96230.1 hypothetical protein DQ237_10225 [Blastococcus sp. TF02-8]
MHVLQGLRQAAVMVAVWGAIAAGAAGLWAAASGEGYVSRLGLSLAIAGGVLSLTGGTMLSRASTMEARAFLGSGPSTEEPDADQPLTAVGVFLFVALPLFAVGLALYGAG